MYLALFQVLFSFWVFFLRPFLALTQPLYSSCSSRVEIQIEHRRSPSAVTYMYEPKGIKNTQGC